MNIGVTYCFIRNFEPLGKYDVINTHTYNGTNIIEDVACILSNKEKSNILIVDPGIVVNAIGLIRLSKEYNELFFIIENEIKDRVYEELLTYGNEGLEDQAYDTYADLRGDIRRAIDLSKLNEEYKTCIK